MLSEYKGNRVYLRAIDILNSLQCLNNMYKNINCDDINVDLVFQV